MHDFEQHQGNLTGVNLEAPTAYPLEDINSWSFNDVSHIYVTLLLFFCLYFYLLLPFSYLLPLFFFLLVTFRLCVCASI